MKYSIVAASVLVAAVSAAPQAGSPLDAIPQCAQSCGLTLIGGSGCSIGDGIDKLPACLCGKPKFQADFAKCVKETSDCSEADQCLLYTNSVDQCKKAGVDATIPLPEGNCPGAGTGGSGGSGGSGGGSGGSEGGAGGSEGGAGGSEGGAGGSEGGAGGSEGGAGGSEGGAGGSEGGAGGSEGGAGGSEGGETGAGGSAPPPAETETPTTEVPATNGTAPAAPEATTPGYTAGAGSVAASGGAAIFAVFMAVLAL